MFTNFGITKSVSNNKLLATLIKMAYYEDIQIVNCYVIFQFDFSNMSYVKASYMMQYMVCLNYCYNICNNRIRYSTIC